MSKSFRYKRWKFLTGFALLELIIVIVLIGIIAIFAVPQFYGTGAIALDKQAKSMLKLIQAAQNTYRLKVGGFTDCSDTDDCNGLLSLNLPPAGEWDYSVTDSSETQFCIQAAGSGTQDWYLSEIMDDPASACEH